MNAGEPRDGEILVVLPGESPSPWQPVPANGSVEVLVAPNRVPMEMPFRFGTHTMPPRCHVREHRHERNDDVIHFLDGHGRAVIDGIDMPLMPGTTLSLGTNDTADIRWTWLAAPNGLGDFFAVIGRQRSAGEAAPPPMARQADMLEIERRSGFAPPSDLQAS